MYFKISELPDPHGLQANYHTQPKEASKAKKIGYKDLWKLQKYIPEVRAGIMGG